MEKPWLKHYPSNVPHEVSCDEYSCITDVLDESVKKYGNCVAYENLGAQLTYRELDEKAHAFAAYLQNVAGLQPGDRIAIQLPNLLQYPVVLFGALKAGLVVVNTNPLYTVPEMVHQFNDAGVKALVILANFAHQLHDVLPKTHVEKVIITEVGDMLPWPKSALVNFVVDKVKKMVPEYHVDGAMSFREALKVGKRLPYKKPSINVHDIAFLQYTGGTTGVSKGAMLTHYNILMNQEQMLCQLRPYAEPGKEIIIAALPLYHAFGLTVNALAIMRIGGNNILITNPRDLDGFMKELAKYRFTMLPGVNTLFSALMNHPDFTKLDFSGLKVSIGAAMALQQAVVDRWFKLTKSHIIEGYGLTEASPLVSVNPFDGTHRTGSIGLPAPSTLVKLLDDDGNEVTAANEPGEICVKGPQVMKGYWNRPEETAKVIDADGWLHTGDIAVWLEDGFMKIVDRKKDMIIVSGFNVYPAEIEDVVALHPDVLEVAAVGIPSEKTGEAVKLFVVRKDPKLTEQELMEHCRKSLTNYKLPRVIEFRDEPLPKSNVGKVLRKDLRQLDKSRAAAKAEPIVA